MSGLYFVSIELNMPFALALLTGFERFIYVIEERNVLEKKLNGFLV